MKTVIKYNVLIPFVFEHVCLKVGDGVRMNERQATFLLSSGKIETAQPAIKKAAKK